MSKNAKRQLALAQKGQCKSTTFDKLGRGLGSLHIIAPSSWTPLCPLAFLQRVSAPWRSYVVRFLFGTAVNTPDDELRKKLYEVAREVDMARSALGLKSAVFDFGMKSASKVTAEAARALKKGLPCPLCKTVVKGEQS